MRVFSAVQPTGRLHIGNYTGGISQFLRLQGPAECLFCIADLHALTGDVDPSRLAADTRQVAALYLAAGLDPGRVTLFVQSHVPAHAQLAWLLACTARVGELRRMTQFKARRGDEEGASVGLFEYPVLMAADILLYDATHVPVGADQRQHLELARSLARRFNHRFGDTFRLPDPLLPEAGARIMALDAPGEKMSKSSPRPDSRIHLLDGPDEVRRKIRAAVTDSARGLTYDPVARPGVANLLNLYAALSGETVDAVASRFGGGGHEAFKSALAELINEHLTPIRERYRRWAEDPAAVEAVLRDGAARAATLAAPVLERATRAVGLLPAGA